MKTVAILYKNAVTRFLTEQTLNSLYSIVSFDSIDALKKGMQCCRPDVVVCEVCDESLDARELFPDISERHPIVFVSFRKRVEERRKVLLQEKHRYLSVPYRPEDLQHSVKLLLNSYEVA